MEQPLDIHGMQDGSFIPNLPMIKWPANPIINEETNEQLVTVISIAEIEEFYNNEIDIYNELYNKSRDTSLSNIKQQYAFVEQEFEKAKNNHIELFNMGEIDVFDKFKSDMIYAITEFIKDLSTLFAESLLLITGGI